jgi:hypothetical protein
VDRLARAGITPHIMAADVESDLFAVTSALKKDDVVLLLTSGSFNGLMAPLVREIDERF